MSLCVVCVLMTQVPEGRAVSPPRRETAEERGGARAGGDEEEEEAERERTFLRKSRLGLLQAREDQEGGQLAELPWVVGAASRGQRRAPAGGAPGENTTWPHGPEVPNELPGASAGTSKLLAKSGFERLKANSAKILAKLRQGSRMELFSFSSLYFLNF